MDEYMKVYKALVTLKEFCNSQDSCESCPLRGHYDKGFRCGVKENIPALYDISRPLDWRCFNCSDGQTVSTIQPD